MGKDSGIEWTDHTFNPWRGCLKVSPACKNCYAETQSKRNPAVLGIWGSEESGATRVVASESMWREPVKWNTHSLPVVERDDGPDEHRRPRVFCASLADVFEDWQGPMVDAKGVELWHNDSPQCWGRFTQRSHPSSARVRMDDVRKRLFSLIDATPHLDWLLLTKRPENILQFWVDRRNQDPSEHYYCEEPFQDESGEWNEGQHRCRPYYRKNVWLGTTVENQQEAEKRIPELLRCRDLSPVLFLSCEPLLGAVDLHRLPNEQWNDYGLSCLDGVGVPHIDWVIAGGESGPNARPSHPDWFRSLRDQCESAGVPFFFKQWGEWLPTVENDTPSIGLPALYVEDCLSLRVGKAKAGRLLDGREWNRFPAQQ